MDAIAAHETAIRQYMKDYDADYRILDESILTTGIGVAFAKNDTRGLSEQLPGFSRKCVQTVRLEQS